MRRRELAEEVCNVIFAVCVLEVAVRRILAVHSENRKERASVENQERRCADRSGRCRQVIYRHLPHVATWTSASAQVPRALGGWHEEVPRS